VTCPSLPKTRLKIVPGGIGYGVGNGNVGESEIVGEFESIAVGCGLTVGLAVGLLTGFSVGEFVSATTGANVGARLGTDVGVLDGVRLG